MISKVETRGPEEEQIEGAKETAGIQVAVVLCLARSKKAFLIHQDKHIFPNWLD